MWITVPDDFQAHMGDRELINYSIQQSGTGIALPSAADIATTAPTDPVILATIAVLTKLASEAEVVVRGTLLSQGVIIDPLPDGDNANFLLHVTVHIAFEHLFLRVPGESDMPTVWINAIKGAYASLEQFRNGNLPLDPAFFTRGAEPNVPTPSFALNHPCDGDAPFAHEWNIPSQRDRGWH